MARVVMPQMDLLAATTRNHCAAVDLLLFVEEKKACEMRWRAICKTDNSASLAASGANQW